MLGGSSGINFMAYGRPSTEDLDDWSTSLNLPGWSWDEVLPYYLKAEKLHSPSKLQTDDHSSLCPLLDKFHGTEGAIHTSLSPYQVPVEAFLLPAFDATAKIHRPTDPWGGKHLGFYRSLFSVNRAGLPTRSYSGNGYLAPVMQRSNLKVLTSAIASKVQMDTINLSAQGVEFICEGATHTVSARKEVILSCGTIESPKLLELSGIGDPEILKAAGLSCIIPLSDVGMNFQEKPVSAVVYELAPGNMSVDSLFMDPALFKHHQKLYKEKHDGALAGAISLMGFFPYSSQVSEAELNKTISSISSPPQSKHTNKDYPFQVKQRHRIISHLLDPTSADIQCVGIPTNFSIDSAYENCSKLSPGPPPSCNACYSIMFSLMYPVSRGSVHIQSSDPLAPPVVDFGF